MEFLGEKSTHSFALICFAYFQVDLCFFSIIIICVVSMLYDRLMTVRTDGSKGEVCFNSSSNLKMKSKRN